MSNNMTVYKNDLLGLEVRTVVGEDGNISINAEDVAIGLGWTREKNNKKYVMWDRMNDYCASFGFPHKCGKQDYISESLFYLLAMKADNKVAQGFQKWIACEVLPQLRKTGVVIMNHATEEAIDYEKKYGKYRIRKTFTNSLDVVADWEQFLTLSKENKVSAKDRIRLCDIIKDSLQCRVADSICDMKPSQVLAIKELVDDVNNEIIRLTNKYHGGIKASQTKRIALLEEELEDKLVELEKAVKKVPISEYMCCNSHPFSANYMFTWENGKCRKTNAYRKWIDGFDYKGLVSVADMWDKVDFTRPITIRLQFVLVPSFDVDNCIKSIVDLLQDRYSFNDNMVRNVLASKREYCNCYEEGKIYIHIENA